MKRIEVTVDLEVFGLGIGIIFNDLYDIEYNHRLSIQIFCICIDIILFKTKNKLFTIK